MRRHTRRDRQIARDRANGDSMNVLARRYGLTRQRVFQLLKREGTPMTDSFTFQLPYPPAGLSPNARVHWRVRASITAAYRQDCGWAVIEARQKHNRIAPIKAPVEAQVTFYVSDRRKRDGDNALAQLKPAWDALKDVRLIDDDNSEVLTILPPRFEKMDGRRRYPYVVIRLTSVAPDATVAE